MLTVPIKATYRDYCPRCTSPILPGGTIEALADGSWIHDTCLRVGDRLQGGWTLIELDGEKIGDKVKGMADAEDANGKKRRIVVEGTD
jgi:hypothetical protein